MKTVRKVVVGLIAAFAVATTATVALAAREGNEPEPVVSMGPTAGPTRAAEAGYAGAYPSRSAVERAIRFSNRDDGILSFAVVDSRGRLDGFEGHRRFVSASVVKAMLLAAELRRLRRAGSGMDPLTAEVLKAMITISDNAAADEIYHRVGDEGLYEVAKKAGMKDFDVYGYWANAQISAVDMARFMRRLGSNMTGPEAGWARRQLASIAPGQRWGIPESIGPAWRIHFKGGWRSTGLGQLVHQVALLRHPNGTVSSVAILSDGQPSRGDAIDDVRQIAGILYSRAPTPPTDPPTDGPGRSARPSGQLEDSPLELSGPFSSVG